MRDELSRKYAKALFELAVEQKTVETVVKELHAIIDAFDQEPKIEHALISLQMKRSAKDDLIEKMWKIRLSPLSFHFVRLVVKKGRVAWFRTMKDEFETMVDDKEGRVKGKAVVSQLLDDADLEKLAKGFSEYIGKQVELKQEVKPEVLGGVAIHLNYQVYDGTVRRRLADIKDRLLAAS